MKRNSFKSYFGFGKSNQKANIDHSPADVSASGSRISRTGDDSPATQMFKRAHEAEVKQGFVVDDLTAKVEELKREVDNRPRYIYCAFNNDTS